jgi:hypothetical protein
MRALKCKTHGTRPWRGEVVCNACGAVYQTHDAGAARFAPEDCACSARLMPSETRDFTARAICSDCFEIMNKKTEA